MSDEKCRQTWSHADEAKFMQMLERREAVMQERRRQALSALDPFLDDSPVQVHDKERLFEVMLKHADRIRDALKDYDSGVRFNTHV